MFKVSNKNTRTMSSVVLVSLLLTLVNFVKSCSSVLFIDFEHVIDGWVSTTLDSGRSP